MLTFSQWITEQVNPSYDEWGWIKPDGTYIDGVKSDSNCHANLILKLKLSGQKEAYNKGWVRFALTKHDSQACVQLAKLSAAGRVAKRFLHDTHFPFSSVLIGIVDSMRREIPPSGEFNPERAETVLNSL